ncbi:hypothetical protein E0H71_00275 [Rhizobium leguminosarum bv. viciae]|nr:hypothetical protein E0H71_00275 [Rhizobium leguminosarum bv. viciae]
MENPYTAAEAFARDFRHMEYAIKRSGFLRKDKNGAEADWDLLAATLGQEFFQHIVATGIARTLVGNPPRRLLKNMTWAPEKPVPLANVAQLIVNGVCRVRNSFIHGEKFIGGGDNQWERDVTLILEAHAVLREAMNFRGIEIPQARSRKD